jgi:hypothetical protein
VTRESAAIRNLCCKAVASQPRVRGIVEAATQGLARRVDEIIVAVGRTRRVADGITEDPHVRAVLLGLARGALSRENRVF